MKVLEKGTGWHLDKRCTGKGNGGGGCESLLRIEIDDFFTTRSYDYGGGCDTFYTFCCPVCGQLTDVPETELPSHVKDKAYEKRIR